MRTLRTSAQALITGSLIGLAACGGGGDSVAPAGGDVRDYITGVQATVAAPVAAQVAVSARATGAGKPARRATSQTISALTAPVQVTAVYRTGTAPAGTGTNTPAVQELSTPLRGQPYRYTVSASGGFTVVYISVAGVGGYWELTLPAGVSSLDLVVTLAAQPPSTTVALRTALGLAGGPSAPTTVTLTPGDLAQADLAVTLKWTGASDLDLHVVDPKGQEVYWNATSTPEGGKLDLDSNAGCTIDNVNQETISWPAGKAPSGVYTVTVHAYDMCGVATSAWSVTSLVKGRAGRSASGSFTGPQADVAQPAFTVTLP